MSSVLISLFFVIPVFLWLYAIIDILRNEFSGSNKIIWLLVTLFLPAVGAILYFFIGRKQKIPSGPCIVQSSPPPTTDTSEPITSAEDAEEPPKLVVPAVTSKASKTSTSKQIILVTLIASFAVIGIVYGLIRIFEKKEKTIDFVVTDNYTPAGGTAVNLEFFIKDHTDLHWGPFYLQYSGTPLHSRLNCTKGETICYGAWSNDNQNKYWGCGKDCKEENIGKCYKCDDTTVGLELH
jgi:hypothetical protein